ncbi:MAG: hypothetical protein ACE5IK_14395 [Acidobacteriota bacterium]
MDLSANCRQEVLDLHRFFDDWFNGRVDGSDEIFQRFSSVLDPAFVIIAPDGRIVERDPLLEAMRQAHGGRAGGAFRIWIENESCRAAGTDLWLCTYEEWQASGDESRGRVSTALFAPDSDAPNEVRWLHVHETWLPGPAPK